MLVTVVHREGEELHFLRLMINRMNGQCQMIDTVFAGFGLVVGIVVHGLTDALMTQAVHVMPNEIFAFADVQCLLKQIRTAVHTQYQTVGVIAAGSVGVLELIRTFFAVFLALRYTAMGEIPGIGALAVKHRIGDKDIGRIAFDDNLIHSIAGVLVGIRTRLGIMLPLEDYFLALTDGERLFDGL